jgi:hypothetical protein
VQKPFEGLFGGVTNHRNNSIWKVKNRRERNFYLDGTVKTEYKKILRRKMPNAILIEVRRKRKRKFHAKKRSAYYIRNAKSVISQVYSGEPKETMGIGASPCNQA